MAILTVPAGARMVDAMEESADVQPAKRVCVERKRGKSSRADCDIVIVSHSEPLHKKQDLQSMLREVRSQCCGVSQWQKVTFMKIDSFFPSSFWIRWVEYSLLLCMSGRYLAQYVLMVLYKAGSAPRSTCEIYGLGSGGTTQWCHPRQSCRAPYNPRARPGSQESISVIWQVQDSRASHCNFSSRPSSRESIQITRKEHVSRAPGRSPWG